MSNNKIRKAVERHLDNLAPAFPTAYENVNFDPPAAPFQALFMLFAEPDDRGFKDSGYIQRGIVTIALLYPTNQGPGLTEAKAEEVRKHFERGTTLVREGVTVVFDRTPEITGGSVEDERFVIRVRCRFYAYIDRA